jgi:uncharacterized repeat protein (TIGR01451 family)
MKMKSIVRSRVGWKTGAILLAAVAAVLVLAPRINSVSKAEECANPPSHAVLNYWPISFDQSQTGCTDYTLLDGKIVGVGSYSLSQADYDDGLQVADGQEAYMRVYVHNGAASNADPSEGTARDVQINVNVPTASSTNHTITASAHGSNTNTVSGSFVLHTAAARGLEIVPNSGELFDAFNQVLVSGIDMSSGHYNMGDQRSCFEFARFLRFKVRVTNPVGNPALSITKQVRNVTQGNASYSSSTTASTGNTVAYQIKVTNTGNATAVHTTVNDTGTSGTSYIGGSLQVTKPFATTGIPGIVDIGDLAIGEVVTINYSSTVTGGTGTYVNTATAQATNVPSVSATASVIVSSVVNNETTLSLTKNVRNITKDSGSRFDKSVDADTGDTVEYQVRIRNTGAVTARAVTMTDNATSGTSFVSGSLNVNPTPSNTSLTLGAIPGTLNLGDIQSGNDMLITYKMRVTGGNGTYINTARAQGSNTNSASDTAEVIVDQGCTSNCGGGSTTRRLSITKLVRNLSTGNSYTNSTSASNGDRVQFQITVKSTGNSRVNNVRLADDLPSRLDLESGSIKVDGSSNSNSMSSISLGNMNNGDSKVVTLIATVDNNDSSCSNNRTLQNVARASADNASTVEDDASVTVGCVQGSNVNLNFSKRAWNDTKNVDATSTTASREDFITYTLTVNNSGNSAATNFVITDDLSGVLPFADLMDKGGASLNGNTLSYPSVTVPAGGSVSKTFRVRVKFNLSQSLTYQLKNTYGNTVIINIGSVLGASTFTAPVTGAAGNSAAAFAGLLVLGFVAYKKRAVLKKLIMA